MSLSAILGFLSSWIKPIQDILSNRNSIKTEISIQLTDRPYVMVTIWNRSSSTPSHIHRVAINYGNLSFFRGFLLPPYEGRTLPPKGKGIWILPYDGDVRIHQGYLSKEPNTTIPQYGPGITPNELFNAIGMGKAEDSWVEIDFNEFTNRLFLRGRVKNIFNAIGKSFQAERKKQPQTKS